MGLATLINKKLYSQDEIDAGKAALLMGFCGIGEGAIPFASVDPLRVIPSIMVGAVVAGNIAMFSGVTNIGLMWTNSSVNGSCRWCVNVLCCNSGRVYSNSTYG